MGTGRRGHPHLPAQWRGTERGEQRKRQGWGGKMPRLRARGRGGRLGCSAGISRAGSGPAEPGARRCGSWLLSSSRTSRSSWSAESRSATTHYFQWAVSCGRAGPCLGAARGRDCAPVPGNCSIPALLPRMQGGGHSQMEGAEGQGEKKEMEKQRERRRERCSGKSYAVSGAPPL